MTGFLLRLLGVVQREPVRVWAYGVLVPGCAVLVVYGVLTAEQAAAWIALGAGVAGVPIGAELVRSRVRPTVKDEPPKFGTGGPISSGQTYIIGEHGPEV